MEDCKLKESSEEYLVKWLIGKYLFFLVWINNYNTISHALNSARFRCGSCRENAPSGMETIIFKFCFINSLYVRKSLEWRRISGADDILTSYTPSEVLKQYFCMGQVGLDKFGCPGSYKLKIFEWHNIEIPSLLFLFSSSICLYARQNGY